MESAEAFPKDTANCQGYICDSATCHLNYLHAVLAPAPAI